jgi:flavin-binding protein dodecin
VRTPHGIEEAWVKGTKAIVRDNKVAEWRVTLKVTFIVS